MAELKDKLITVRLEDLSLARFALDRYIMQLTRLYPESTDYDVFKEAYFRIEAAEFAALPPRSSPPKACWLANRVESLRAESSWIPVHTRLQSYCPSRGTSHTCHCAQKVSAGNEVACGACEGLSVDVNETTLPATHAEVESGGAVTAAQLRLDIFPSDGGAQHG